MRTTSAALLTAFLCTSAASGADRDEKSVVWLLGPEALAELEQTNPAHHERAVKIIAAAADLCRPSVSATYYVQFQEHEVSCSESLLLTSNPPKRRLSFELDDTRYVALVTVPNSAGKLHRLDRRFPEK